MLDRWIINWIAKMAMAVCVVILFPGCAVAPPTLLTEVSQPLSLLDAHHALSRIQGRSLCTGTSISASCTDIHKVTVHSDAFIINDHLRYEYANLPQLSVSEANFDSTPAYLILRPDEVIWTGLGKPGNQTAQTLANSLLVLKRAASSAGNQQMDANFEKVAQEYQSAATKPKLSEESHRFKVQAEAAVRDKKFDDAADLYEQALEIAPWWPEGHFNRSLVLSETQDYETAIFEMKRYLVLVPNAPDARAAQDKIYEWEGKVGKSN